MKFNTFQYKHFIINCLNEEEARKIIEEKFENEEYKTELTTDTPLIIDAGAHIGISVLYFKSVFPKSRIIAFEPEPNNFQLLEKNISVNNLTDVSTYNYALSNYEGEAVLLTPFDSPKRAYWGNTLRKELWGPDDPDTNEIRVQTIKLSTYINEKIDLLKLDIEGEETNVIKELEQAGKFPFIKNIVLEFHKTISNSSANNRLLLENILLRNDYLISTTKVDLLSHGLSRAFIDEYQVEYFLIRAKRSS